MGLGCCSWTGFIWAVHCFFIITNINTHTETYCFTFLSNGSAVFILIKSKENKFSIDWDTNNPFYCLKSHNLNQNYSLKVPVNEKTWPGSWVYGCSNKSELTLLVLPLHKLSNTDQRWPFEDDLYSTAYSHTVDSAVSRGAVCSVKKDFFVGY